MDLDVLMNASPPVTMHDLNPQIKPQPTERYYKNRQSQTDNLVRGWPKCRMLQCGSQQPSFLIWAQRVEIMRLRIKVHSIKTAICSILRATVLLANNCQSEPHKGSLHDPDTELKHRKITEGLLLLCFHLSMFLYSPHFTSVPEYLTYISQFILTTPL